MNSISTCFKNFGVVENLFPNVTKLNITNTKSISTLEFITLYWQFLITSYLKFYLKLIFVFKSKTPSHIGHSKTSVYWTSNNCARRYFARQTLHRSHLISYHKMLFCHWQPCVSVFCLYINLFLYFFESKCPAINI